MDTDFTIELQEAEIELKVQDLIDVFVEHGMIVQDYIQEFGTYSNWQINMLREQGLTPADNLLDIGCGALRLGIQAIPYLEDGNYHGIELQEEYLDIGRQLIDSFDISKGYHLVQSGEFEYAKFDTRFDVAIAQSVFTHLTRSQIETCLENLREVMSPEGEFYYTYIPSKETTGSLYNGSTPMLHGALTENLLSNMGSKYAKENHFTDIDHPTQNVGFMVF